MLCKRTMRAALAPVVGLVGLLGATMVSAQDDLEAVVVSQVPDEMEMSGAVMIASETLSTDSMTDDHYHVVTSSSTPTGTTRTDANKPDRWLELRTEVDILLSHRGVSDHYYVRYELDGMVFSKAPSAPEVRVPYTAPCGSGTGEVDCNSVGGVTPTATSTSGYLVDRSAIAVAYRGRPGDNTVIYRLPSDPTDGAGMARVVDGSESSGFVDVEVLGTDQDYVVGTTITLLLPDNLAVVAAREATYRAEVKVFEDLSEAREDDFGAEVFGAAGDVVMLTPAVGAASVDALLAMAEVSTPESLGGAFRRFVDSDDAGTEPDRTANLANVSVGLANPEALHANDNLNPVDASIIRSVSATATSDAGNFGFGATFHIGEGGCSAAIMSLRKPGDDGGLVRLDAEESQDVATAAISSARGGDSTFCIRAAAHRPASDPAPPIPEVGDATELDGYWLIVTPMIADSAPTVVHPPMGMAMAAGSIIRNGTTVHISYLSGSENANQRLVIVNRGGDPARFWINDFQAEGDQTVSHGGDAMLAQASMSEVPGGGRMVVRIQDNLSFSERPPRAAGTLTVAAPTRHIDVMTVQIVGGALDTTVYQHAEL